MTTEFDPPEYDDELLLRETQRRRLEMLQQLQPKENEPVDPKIIQTQQGILRDIDSQILVRRKIKVDEKQVDQSAHANRLAEEVLTRLNPSQLIANFTEPRPGASGAPALPDNLPPLETVPGETRVGVENLELKSFLDGKNTPTP